MPTEAQGSERPDLWTMRASVECAHRLSSGWPDDAAGDSEERCMDQKVERIYRLTARGELLGTAAVHEIRRLLNAGGLCIIPSDTCYALAGIPFVRGVVDLIDAILARGTKEMPLTFGSLVQAERFVEFNHRHYRLMDNNTGDRPLTVVAPISTGQSELIRKRLPEVIHTDGTIGVRLPHSWVERQLSSELDQPTTTAAITYPDGQGVRNLADAISVVEKGLEVYPHRVSFVAVEHPPIKAKHLSSVVEIADPNEHPDGVIVHREADVDRKTVIQWVGRISSRDIEDWT